MSFHYLRKKSQKKLDELLYRTSPEDVVYFIDSGAFTFQSVEPEEIERQGTQAFLDKVSRYVDEYAQFLERYRSRIFCAAEMDIDSVFDDCQAFGKGCGRWTLQYREQCDDWNLKQKWSGKFGYAPQPVLDWRKQLQQTGVPIVVGWHECRDWAGWLDQCQKHPYNAVGSDHNMAIGQWFRYLNEARKTKTRVHGFAVTKPEYIRRYPFYSVDSTSWLDGSKFGTTFAFQSGRIRYYTNLVKDQVRKRLRRVYKEWGVDLEALDADRGEAVDEINLIAWMQYAEYLHRVPNKDYWESEANGQPKGSLGPPRGESSPVEIPVELDDLSSVDPENEFSGVGGEPEMEEGEIVSEPPKISVSVPAIVEKNPLRILDNKPAEAGALAKMKCDNCYISDSCDYKQDGAECHFELSNTFTSPAEFAGAFQTVLQLQYQRILHATMIEKRDGGVIDRQLSAEFQRLTDMMMTFREMVAPRAEPDLGVKIEAKGKGAVSQLLEAVFAKKTAKKQ
jgi:hypothetical protein